MIASETEIAYFMELYELRHFTRAATKLRVSQSALTQSISKLEGKIGAILFYRSKKGCTPTPSGEVFFQEAQQLLENWTRLLSSVSHRQQALSGNFRVGCHPSLGVYALPRFLRVLSRKAPEIEISLVHDFSRNLSEKVIAHELDLAIVVNPVRHADLILHPISEDRICLWKAKATKSPPKRIFTDMSRAEVQSFLGKHAARFRDWRVVESTSLELIRALVSEGLGVGVLPERVASVDAKKLELMDESAPTLRDEVHVIYRSDALKTNSGRVLREVARTFWKS